MITSRVLPQPCEGDSEGDSEGVMDKEDVCESKSEKDEGSISLKS
jgi:hypothetical protein